MKKQQLDVRITLAIPPIIAIVVLVLTLSKCAGL
jgi:hypothetical protein